VRWPQKRWRLMATPTDHDDELSVGISQAITAADEHYWTKRGAEQAVRFYRYKLKLPVKFWIIHMKKDQ